MSAAMGFDFGLSRIGVAVGSFDSLQAEALTVLRAKNGCPDWDHLRQLVVDWQPSIFVIGNLPRNESASSQASTTYMTLGEKILAFRTCLQKEFQLPTAMIDESYSSHEARLMIKKSRQSGHPARTGKGVIDMVSAAIILQSWILQEKSGKPESRDLQ